MAKKKGGDHALAEEIAKSLDSDLAGNPTAAAGADASALLQRARDAGGGALRAQYLAQAQRAIARLNPARDQTLIQHLQGQILALQGRGGDTKVAHVTPGEIVVPKRLQTPAFMHALAELARAHGIDPASLQVGSVRNAVNPNTGQPEFDDSQMSPRYSMDYLDPLTRVTFGEAEGEGPKGWDAVIGTVLNRAGSPGFPKTVPDVIHQKNAFESVTNGRYDFDPAKLPQDDPRVKAWNGIQDMARSRLQDAMDGNVPYAPRFFRQVGAPSPWFDKSVENGTLEPVGTIGNHEFYEDPKRKKP